MSKNLLDYVGLGYFLEKIKTLFVTGLGTSGNNLTWTKNGTTNNITVPYATKTGKLSVTSTDNAVVRFDGTTGAVLNSRVIIDDSANITLPNAAYIKLNKNTDRYLTISGNDISHDMTEAAGGYAGSFYSVKTKGSDNETYTTTGIGFFGGSGSAKGLYYLYVASPGKGYSNPDIKFNVDGTTNFLSSVTAPTAASGTNNTQVATTAFVKNAVDSKVHYIANLLSGTAANYITEPEVKTIKINGSTTNSASTSNCVLLYDTTNKCLKFVFN